MKKTKKKGRWQQGLAMGMIMLLSAVCGVLIARVMEQQSAWYDSTAGWLFSMAAMVVGLFVGFFLQMIIHEAGHLVFGLKSGYRFSSFRIGSLMWLKEDGRLVTKKLTVAGTGGQCLMIPPERENGTYPVILYNLGGCIMNLAASALFLVPYLLLPKGTAVGLFCLIVVLAGVILALTNGIPLRLGTVNNDGYNALSLGKDPAAMEAFWLQLKVNEQIAKGVRLKDMPQAWFFVPPDAAMENSMVATQAVFAANRLMDQHNFEEADRLISHLLEIDSGIVGLHRNLLICDWMYCRLIREDQDMAEQMLTGEQKQFMKSMKNFPTVIRTEYVYALLRENDSEKAAAARKHFEKVAKTYP